MEECARLVICCVILHNMCLKYGDNVEDFQEDFEQPPNGQDDQNPGAAAAAQNERRLLLVRQFIEQN
jgi:hypothetical protein